MTEGMFLSEENVSALVASWRAELRNQHRTRGFELTDFERDNIDEAVAVALVDLVDYWVHLPSSLAGSKEFQWRKARKRGGWVAKDFIHSYREQRTEELLDAEEARGLTARPADPDTPEDGERRRRKERLVRWALAEMPERERHVLRELHAQHDPPSKRALARTMGVSEAAVRKIEKRARKHFKDLLSPWLGLPSIGGPAGRQERASAGVGPVSIASRREDPTDNGPRKARAA